MIPFVIKLAVMFPCSVSHAASLYLAIPCESTKKSSTTDSNIFFLGLRIGRGCLLYPFTVILSPGFHKLGGINNSTSVLLVFSAHKIIPWLMNPATLRGLRLAATTTIEFCILSIGTNSWRPLAIRLGCSSPKSTSSQ